jgi:hypothetical protein
MAYLMLSAARRFSQPRGTIGINWADRITDRLCLAVNWRDGNCFNLVSNERGTVESHSTYDKRGDLFGRTANVSYPYVGKFNTDHLVKTSNGSGTGDFSFFSLSSPQKSASYPEALLSMNGTSSGTQTILMVNKDENMTNTSGAVSFGVFWSGTPYFVTGTGNNWSSGEPTTFMGVRSGTTYYVDANGVQLNSATRSAQNIFDTFDLVNIGGMEGYSSGWSRPTTTHFGALAWNRALTAPERREIGRWPWMWTKRDPQRTYFDLTKAQEIRDQVAEIAAPKRSFPAIHIGTRRTKQPQGVVRLNRQIFDSRLQILLDAKAGIDHVSGKRLTCTTSNSAIYPYDTGLGAYVGSANTDNAWRADGATTTPYTYQQSHTIFVFFIYNVVQTGSYNYIAGNFDGSNAAGISVQHNNISGRWGCYDNAVSLMDSGEYLPLGVHFIVQTRDGTWHRQYRNGVKKGEQANSNSDIRNTVFTICSLGYGHGYGMSSNVPVMFGGRTTHVWTAEDIRSISASPWQLFERDPCRIYIDLGRAKGTMRPTVRI